MTVLQETIFSLYIVRRFDLVNTAKPSVQTQIEMFAGLPIMAQVRPFVVRRRMWLWRTRSQSNASLWTSLGALGNIWLPSSTMDICEREVALEPNFTQFGRLRVNIVQIFFFFERLPWCSCNLFKRANFYADFTISSSLSFVLPTRRLDAIFIRTLFL